MGRDGKGSLHAAEASQGGRRRPGSQGPAAERAGAGRASDLQRAGTRLPRHDEGLPRKADLRVLLPHSAPGRFSRHTQPARQDVEADILDFSSENLDNWGGRFLENEEIMLEIARWRLAGSNIAAHTQNYPNNPTLPVYIPRSRSDWFDGVYFYVTPSRPLFDRYFQGKELDYRPWGKEPPAPADFNRIGWKKSEGAREKKERDKEPGKESDKK